MPTIHNGQPAVNIKCYNGVFDVSLPLDLGKESDDGGKTWVEMKTDPAYTHQWIKDNVSEDDLYEWWNIVAEDTLKQCIENWTEDFQAAGYSVEIGTAGRSGGWLEVLGLDAIEDWPEDLVEVWKQFESECAEVVENFPARLATEMYFGIFEAKKAEAEEKEEQIKAIWQEVQEFIFGRTGNAEQRQTDLLMGEFFEYCPLLVAQVEAIRK